MAILKVENTLTVDGFTDASVNVNMTIGQAALSAVGHRQRLRESMAWSNGQGYCPQGVIRSQRSSRLKTAKKAFFAGLLTYYTLMCVKITYYILHI